MATTKKKTKKKTKRKLVRRTREGQEAVATASGGDFDRLYKEGLKTWTPKGEGKYKIRILPAGWGDEDNPPDFWGVKVWVHPSLGPDNRDAYICPNKTNGDPCPICDAINEAKRTGSIPPRDTEAGRKHWANQVKPYERVLAYVLVRSDSDIDDEGVDAVRLFPMAPSLAKAIAQQGEDPDDGEVLYLDDLEDGYDLTFKREGTGMKTRYGGVQLSRKSTAADDEDDVLDDLEGFVVENALPEAFIVQTADYLDSVFNGTAGTASADEEDDEIEEEEEEEEETKPARRSRRSRASDEEEEDEDEDESDDLDEDEEEEVEDEEPEGTKAKIRKGLRRTRRDQDEDED